MKSSKWKELSKLKKWFKLRIKWVLMGRPSSALWDAIFANYDKSNNWIYTPFPESLRGFIKYEYLENPKSELGDTFAKIIQFFNPNYIRLVRVEAEPRTINVCWSKLAEMEIDKIFNTDITAELTKGCIPPKSPPVGLFSEDRTKLDLLLKEREKRYSSLSKDILYKK
jgi:hypothetical protein